MGKAKEILKKNTMLAALVVVALFFAWQTNGVIFDPQNVTNLIAQNGYVVILAVGMLMCILTGGNIDLSTGSVVCLVGAIAGKLIISSKMNFWLAILICLAVGILIGVWPHPSLYRNLIGNAFVEGCGADHLRRPDPVAVSRRL